jgi:hypothetical protein
LTPGDSGGIFTVFFFQAAASSSKGCPPREFPVLDFRGVFFGGIGKRGAARAKTEAVHFLCSFLRNHLMEELEGQPLLRIMQTMMDALELEDDQVTADILELFIAMARLAPECVAFLLEREFDTWLLESPQRLRLPFADERLYDLLAYSRRTAACKPFGRR